ncbi:diacylglycerol kinase 1-like [Aristolochia californica]|uniref:diacylglycerol kinase 1-like n=1 Tax=Aristolochia californica TaxID=171875 RepID=UPI0035D802D8
MGDKEAFLQQFYIPYYIFEPQAVMKSPMHIPECPVIVFINSRSGGLTCVFPLAFNPGECNFQVFDLGDEAPDKVLHKLYHNLETLKSCNDDFASEIQKRLKLIVAGGDGTASWLLGVVSNLN